MTGKKRRNPWLQAHLDDHHVRQAQHWGYRSRAAFKLLEINERETLFFSGICVVDLGAAPGSWSQVVVQELGNTGSVFALDLLPMEPLDRVQFVQGDFGDEAVLRRLEVLLSKRQVDLVISDMAPNLTGVRSVDQARSYHLVGLAFDFAMQHLKLKGNFLVKVFHGSEFDTYCRQMKQAFSTFKVCKPKASRHHSTEIYLLGVGKK